MKRKNKQQKLKLVTKLTHPDIYTSESEYITWIHKTVYSVIQDLVQNNGNIRITELDTFEQIYGIMHYNKRSNEK
jgi:hypothetical protein|tara:strand:- start:1921 stop:2145 length:225 start_codon:yes stop_codon:yes gene_type:complete